MSDLRYLMGQMAALSLEDLHYLRKRLNELLGDEPDPDIGVREPRRPKPESGEGAVALVEDDEQ